jgi:dipeptidase D
VLAQPSTCESPFSGLRPASLWDHFEQITKIGRRSGHEAAIRTHIQNWASSRKLPWRPDEVGNLRVRVPATTTVRGAETIVLQSHLDMVCERNSDSPFDPAEGRIRVCRDDGWIHADGTTLGADNGIGVATMLAVAEDRQAKHGPLELLFTVDEETGLTGAANLKPEFITGRRLLNLDSEEENVIFVGSAGGCDVRLTWRGRREPVPESWQVIVITVKGLLGGHSGVDISKGRLNAIRAMVRLLIERPPGKGFLPVPYDLRLLRMEGGNRSNAIPRECELRVALPPEQVEGLLAKVNRAKDVLVESYGKREPELDVTAYPLARQPSSDPVLGFDRSSTLSLLQLLYLVPVGPRSLRAQLSNTVETSANLASVHTGGEAVEIIVSLRSLDDGKLSHQIKELLALAGPLTGIEATEVFDRYPPWPFRTQSPTCRAVLQAFRTVYADEASTPLRAIHGGLECGFIARRISEMDMVSFGPIIEGAHSPGERVNILSVQRFWNVLLAALKNLTEPNQTEPTLVEGRRLGIPLSTTPFKKRVRDGGPI